MAICGGTAQTNGGEVRRMEIQQSDRPQGCPLGAYLSRNKDKGIYTDVPKLMVNSWHTFYLVRTA